MTDFVLTLIADPTKYVLTQEIIEYVANKMSPDRISWLSEREACELHWIYEDPLLKPLLESFPAKDINENWLGASTHGAMNLPPVERRNIMFGAPLSPDAIAKAASSILGEIQIDCLAQIEPHRPKKLLIADMDSTMITVECLDELADFVGKKAEVSAITDRAMNGELDFAAALVERVRLLKGLPETALQQCYDERVTLMPGARELVQTMRANGAHTVLVSGGFTFFTARVAEALGFHEHYGNALEIKEGVLTGEVVPPILGKEAKLQKLQETCAKLGILPEDALAVGDGANDLPMLLAAGLGIAYHAKPVVQQQAKHRINHTNLRALVFAQGLAITSSPLPPAA